MMMEKNCTDLVLEGEILSICFVFPKRITLCVKSNLANAAIFFSKRKIDITRIDNGNNSNNIFFAQILWYIKKYLPFFLGGFKINFALRFLFITNFAS